MLERRQLTPVRVAIGLSAVGVLAALISITIKAVTADNDHLGRIADQSQVLGTALAVVSAGVAVWRHYGGRLTDQGVTDWPAELTARVRRAEDRNRRALLSNVHAADLPLDEVDDPDELRQWFTDPQARRMRLETLDTYYRSLGAHGRLVILGDPGAGKTVTAVQLIVRLLPALGDDQPIPVRFSLAGWDSSRPVEEWLSERLALDYRIPPAQADNLVGGRRILPVLDGLDEMDPDEDGSLPHRAMAMLSWLNEEHTADGSRAGVIVTCRSPRYLALTGLGSGLHEAKEIRVLGLEPEQITAYIKRVFAGQAKLLADWAAAFAELEKPGAGPIWALLATPWRLTLAITLVKAGRKPQELLSVRGDETPVKAAGRIRDELLSRYVESATKLTGEQEAGRGTAEATHYLAELARRLRHTSTSAASSDFSAIDIVPFRLFGSERPPRAIHAAIAGSVMAIGCLLLALDGIGPVQIWAQSAGMFFTQRMDFVERVFEDLLPAICLLAAPIIAARLAFSASPAPIARAGTTARFARRVRRNLTYAGTGGVFFALASTYHFGPVDSFDRLAQMFDIDPRTYTAAVVFSGAGYFLYLWLRRRLPHKLRLVTAGVLVLASLWQPLLSLFDDSDRPSWWLATDAAVMVVLWGVALALTGRQTNALADAVDARIRPTGGRGTAGLVGSVALLTFATWVAVTLVFASGHPLSLLRPLEFVPGSFAGYGIGAGLVAGLSTAFRRPLGGGVLVGFLTGFSVGLIAALSVEVSWADAWVAAAIGVVATSVLGTGLAAVLISVLLRDPVPVGLERRIPHAALRDDLVAASVTAVAIAVPVLIAFGAGVGDIFGIAEIDGWGAIAVAVASALAFGPLGRRAWFRYRIGSALAAARGELPWRLSAFFDWAVAAGLLRTNGSAYQFRHLELQQWLLQHPTPAGRATEPVG